MPAATPHHLRHPALASALRLALAFALVKLAIQIAGNLWQTHIGWSYFRDEFYFIACGRHLAWGYVDHGPIVALQARIAETLFGHSLAGLRLLSALAGACRTALTGLLACALGGRRPAQGLAMLAVLIAPTYLSTDGVLSMNSFESLFWMTCLLALLILQHRLDLIPATTRTRTRTLPLSSFLASRNFPSMSAMSHPSSPAVSTKEHASSKPFISTEAEADTPSERSLLTRAQRNEEIHAFSSPATNPPVPRPSQPHRNPGSPSASLVGWEGWDVSTSEGWDVSRPDPPHASTLTPWLLFGLSAGIGLLNKPSMAFFLIALGLALLATHTGRALLLRRHALVGIAVMLFLVAPYLRWQVEHHWPTLEFLHNGELHGKNHHDDPLDFIGGQFLALLPLNGLVWLMGLFFLLRRRAFAWIGLCFLFFFALMMALDAKDYYLHPIYPVLFAAGGVAWERRFRWRRTVQAHRAFAFPYLTALLTTSALILLPTAIPVLPPATWIRYTRAMQLFGTPDPPHILSAGRLPQSFGDRFGWQEQVNQIRRLIAALPPADRARVTIMTANYGEAGALQLLAPDIPHVVCAQNNFYLWGPGDASGDLVLFITNRTPEDLGHSFEHVRILDHLDTGFFAMPWERGRPIYLLRGPRRDLQTLWPNFKDFI